MIKYFYLTQNRILTGTTIQDRVDLRVMIMKEYIKFPQNPRLERHNQM